MGVPCSTKHSAELLAGCFGLKGAPTSSFLQSPQLQRLELLMVSLSLVNVV